MKDRLKELFPELRAENKPSVVWFCDVSDEKTNRNIDGKIFKNEPMGLALKRFNCFRVNVLDMPEGDLKDKYAKMAPAFLFFDPAAEPIGRPLVRKRATSLSGFSRLVESAWSKCFTMPLKTYNKQMKGILDALDRVDVKKQKNDKDKERLAKKPNPAKQKKVDKISQEIKEELAKIEEDEKAIFESCALKPEYLPPEEVGEK